MPSSCCVSGCKGNYRTGPKVNVYSFPRDEKMQNRWLLAIRRKDFIVKRSSKVCELHFKESDFEREASAYDPQTGRTLTAPLNHARIKKGAVPSLHLLCVNPSNESLNKEVSKEEISMGDREKEVSHTLKQNIASIPSEKCHSKNVPESNLALENSNGKKPAKRGRKRKRKYFGRRPSNQVNNSENCDLNSNQITSTNENSIEKNDSLSNGPQSVLTVSIKVEKPWEGDYNCGGNYSGDKSENCDKMQIEIGDVRSVVSNENNKSSTEKVDESCEKILDRGSMLTKPLKISKREEIFGKLVASEISDLSENPGLYIKTKQAILNILVQAQFEQMKYS